MGNGRRRVTVVVGPGITGYIAQLGEPQKEKESSWCTKPRVGQKSPREKNEVLQFMSGIQSVSGMLEMTKASW